jgi:hypothetical protein
MAEPGRLPGRAAPAMALQAVDGTAAAARGEVTAFREDDQSVLVSQARGEVADQGDRLVAVPVGVDEAVRDPAQQHVYPWIKGERVLEHEQRPPARIRQQAVKEQEGISWPGVPGQDDDGPGHGARMGFLPLLLAGTTSTRSPNSQRAARYRRASSISMSRKFKS